MVRFTSINKHAAYQIAQFDKFVVHAFNPSGLHAPRVSEFPSKPLPTARVVSIQINNASGITDDDLVARVSVVNSLMLMQLGQFVDHDFARTPTPGKTHITLLYRSFSQCL